MVRSTARVQGLASLACVFVPRPGDRQVGYRTARLRGWQGPDDRQAGHAGSDRRLDQRSCDVAAVADRSTPRFVEPDTEDNLHQLFLDNHWTDTLPVVLPTEERVAAMLAHTSHAPDEIVGRMQATANRGQWEYTVEKVAVNAVMAGARPDIFR